MADYTAKIAGDRIEIEQRDNGRVYGYGALTRDGYEDDGSEYQRSILKVLAENGQTVAEFLAEQGLADWAHGTAWAKQDVVSYPFTATGSTIRTFPREIAARPEVVAVIGLATYPKEHRSAVLAIVRKS